MFHSVSCKPILLAALVVGAGAGAFSNLCFAQSKLTSRWTASITTKVKPEMRREFEGCLKEWITAYRKAGTLWFFTFETFAGDTTEYTTVLPVLRFGDLDEPSAIRTVLGDGRSERLSRKTARCYTSQICQYATPHTELEIKHGEALMRGYWVETRTLVAPGKMVEYLNWLKSDYSPALEKAGVQGFRVSQPIFGAAGGEIVTMRLIKNLTEIDGGTVLSRAVGEDQARTVASKSVALVSSSSTRILRMRSDLSYSMSN